MSLNEYARNEFSQNGEDGIVDRIFSAIGPTTRWCCEFGAWDGRYLSNTRALILAGWSAVLIECDQTKFEALESCYSNRPDVHCVNAAVGADAPLSTLLAGVPRLDFLSIDIDGLDYESLAGLDIEPPRVICIEVGPGHDPAARGLLPREIAARNVGQPFAEVVDVATSLGYRLVGYTGNAFFVHSDAGRANELPTVTAIQAYEDAIEHLDREGREWLYLLNLGLVSPHYSYRNPHLGSRRLGIGPVRATWLRTAVRWRPVRAIWWRTTMRRRP